MRHLQVLAIYPNITDPTSFYRGAGPLGALRKQYRDRIDFTFHTPTQVAWSDVVDMDLVFMQRPSIKSWLAAAEIAERCQVPLWVDFDDDLLAITKDNQNYDNYSSPDAVDTIKKVTGLASAITVSTSALSKTMFPLAMHAKVRKVIPNAWNDFLFPDGWKYGPHDTKNIVWRGSSTHIYDLMQVADDIIDVAREYPDWHWIFLGFNPFYITSKLHNCSHAKSKDILLYLKSLAETESTLMIVPLADTNFNRAKSMIAWEEATYAGAAVLAPNFDEWRRTGIGNYEHGRFAESLRKLIKSNDVRRQMVEWSRRHIDDQLLLSKVNQHRFDVLQELSLL